MNHFIPCVYTYGKRAHNVWSVLILVLFIYIMGAFLIKTFNKKQLLHLHLLGLKTQRLSSQNKPLL